MFGGRSKVGAVITAAGVAAASCNGHSPDAKSNLSEFHFGNPRTDAELISHITKLVDADGHGTFTAKDGSTYNVSIHNEGSICVQRVVSDDLGGLTQSTQYCFANGSIYHADEMITTNSAGTELTTHFSPDTTQAAMDNIVQMVLAADIPQENGVK